ncbi:TetR/AcrR family transcriptional regulator C-terminal domain-containing protein [Actinomadura kijaniata]|uniref:TetR/AcrR family transcriptional regulator C-terminal domain-containing protein n=1 Tax=Actinomadura kijaniata TaxID=46161 RepID=UPI003F1D4BAB
MAAGDQAFPSVWTRPPRRRRDRPALTRDQIVAEAVRLLDEEGLDALTMRRLAARLGAAANALYWHVTNKSELIELVVDEIYGEMRLPDTGDPADWRATVTELAHSAREVILRHPWTSGLLGEVGMAYLGPNLTRLFDRALTLLRSADFPLPAADRALNAVFSFVIGAATVEAATLNKIRQVGLTEDEWLRSVRPTLEESTQDHPQMRELYVALAENEPERKRREQFDYGLQRMLDGIASQLAEHP